jgi:hypothetical protein
MFGAVLEFGAEVLFCSLRASLQKQRRQQREPYSNNEVFEVDEGKTNSLGGVTTSSRCLRADRVG